MGREGSLFTFRHPERSEAKDVISPKRLIRAQSKAIPLAFAHDDGAFFESGTFTGCASFPNVQTKEERGLHTLVSSAALLGEAVFFGLAESMELKSFLPRSELRSLASQVSASSSRSAMSSSQR